MLQRDRFNRKYASVCLLVVALVGTSCTSGGGGGSRRSVDGGSNGANGDDDVDPNDVGTASAFFSAFCNALVRCNEKPFITGVQSCQNLLNIALGCEPGFASATVIGVKACGDSLNDVSCDVLAANGFASSACSRALNSLERSLGAVDEGEVCEPARCLSDAECVSDGQSCLRCEGHAGKEGEECGDSGCEGALTCGSNRRCTKLSPTGKGCEFSEECETGACLRGVCASPAVGDACEDEEGCGDSLACRDGKCAKLGRIGESCTAEGQCTFDARCLEGRCSSLPSCRSAGSGSQCLFDGQCVAGLACGEDTCVKPAELGESCESVNCREGLTCSFDTQSGEGICDEGVVRTPEQCAAEESNTALTKSAARRVKPRFPARFDWAQLRLAPRRARQ